MKQSNLQKIQNQIRDKFLKQELKWLALKQFFFKRYKNWKKCNY